MERIPITPQGLKMLQEELEKIRTVDRPQNIRDIEEARAHGDLSENAEYHAAKERQSFLEGRMRELEFKVNAAEVLDPKKMPKDRVVFGNIVILESVDTGDEVRYQLVGPDESDVTRGKISVTSPIGKALVGKVVDDEVKVQAPGGMRRYMVVDIE